MPAHGFARIVFWDVQFTQTLTDGGTEVILKMPCEEACLQYKKVLSRFNCELILKVTVANTLKVELTLTNHSQHELLMNNALHSYFKISDIRNISIQGLENTTFHDKLNHGQFYTQEAELKFDNEIDRVFINTQSDIVLNDPYFGRNIIISKANSNSTVIWNPWQEKSASMSDMSDQSRLDMVCIEPLNVHENHLLLEPGETHSISTFITVNQIL